MKRGVLFLLLVMIAVIPWLAYASGSYVAGDLTKTAVSDSLEQGNQVHFHVSVKGQGTDNPTAKQIALNDLLSRVSVDGIEYLKDGQQFGRLYISIDDIQIFDIKATQNEDGTVSFATNLMNDTVFVIPASFDADNFSPLDLLYDNSGIQSTDEGFDDLPAMQRLRVTVSELTLMITKTVLGWVSMNQIDTDGEFYQFDFTYLEPTETRSGVTQRMIGKVTGDQFCALLWDIMSIIDWQCGKFQEAVADILAENGVTRLQARAFTDNLFPDIPIDPAEDFVVPTHAITNGDDCCESGDISYFFKKTNKFLDKIWEESYSTPLELIVSYNDDYGYSEMVGLDAVLPKFTESLPYEGTFSYSRYTDDDWQVLTTSHGELQIDEEKRIIGDLQHLNGEDIDGHNGNTFDAYLMLYDLNDNTKIGFGIDGDWTYDTKVDGDLYIEDTSGTGTLSIGLGTKDMELITAEMNGVMKTSGTDFEYSSNIDITFLSSMAVQFMVKMEQEKVVEFTMPDGEIIDIMKLNENSLEMIKRNIKTNLFTTFVQMIEKEDILEDIKVLFVD